MANGKGQVIAEIKPGTKEFGWSRRNAVIQPLVDRVLADGCRRHHRHPHLTRGHPLERADGPALAVGSWRRHGRRSGRAAGRGGAPTRATCGGSAGRKRHRPP
jgi:hypothetical protein